MGETLATRQTKAYTYGAPTCGIYKELDLVTIPEPISELGIAPGTVGMVDHVYEGGRRADVEVSDKDGSTIGYVTIDADPEPHIVAYFVEEDD